jgi:hypothetical protein
MQTMRTALARGIPFSNAFLIQSMSSSPSNVRPWPCS